MKEPPRILIMFELHAGWDRGVLRGLVNSAREHGWDLMQVRPAEAEADHVRNWQPAAVVIEDYISGIVASRLRGTPVIAANVDLTPHGIPSVCCREESIARLAAEHLLSTGLRNLAGFAYSTTAFGEARIAAFRQYVTTSGGTYHEGGEFSGDSASPDFCSHDAIINWLSSLPRPCGIFACCDSWARHLAHYCRRIALKVPEDIALVGADNDTMLCELTSPPMSSVAVPWQRFGATIGQMINDHLHGRPLEGCRINVEPIGVVMRRSSSVLAIADPEVAAAVRFIRQNAHRPIAVDEVVRAATSYRQKMERSFKAVLGRTIMEEVRQAHVSLARQLLVSTHLSTATIAARCGFANATMLGIAFRRETGMTPSAYRRRFDHDEEPSP